jgi:hypothetical protein
MRAHPVKGVPLRHLLPRAKGSGDINIGVAIGGTVTMGTDLGTTFMGKDGNEVAMELGSLTVGARGTGLSGPDDERTKLESSEYAGAAGYVSAITPAAARRSLKSAKGTELKGEFGKYDALA